MLSEGLDRPFIARCLGISRATLERRFAGELSAVPKKQRGRKAFEPTKEHRHTVEVMRAGGMSAEIIGKCLGISEPTLWQYFRAEMELGKAKTDTKVMDTWIKQAIAGNTALICFYAKTRMGMRETTRVETTGADGGPVQVEHAIDLKSLPDDALAKLAAVAEAIGERDRS